MLLQPRATVSFLLSKRSKNGSILFLTFFFLHSPILFLVKFIFWSGALKVVSSSGYNCRGYLLPSSSPCVEFSHGDVSLSLNLESSAQDLHNFLWSTQVCESDSKQCWQTQNSWLGIAAAPQTGTTAPGTPLRAVASGDQRDQPPWAPAARAAAIVEGEHGMHCMHASCRDTMPWL